MDDAIETDLNVTIEYDKTNNLIILMFAQEERLISVGFSIPEAQGIHAMLLDVITAAILEKLSTSPSETRH